VSTLDVDVDLRKVLRLPGADDLRALVDAVRNGEVIQLVAGRERRAQLDEIQATMALIEGYAEHVMDAVGEQVLPDLGALREGLERRRRERSGLFRLLEKLIGLDMKLRQYEHGKQFCDAVVAEAGIAGLNLAWARPENLPTLAELDQPTGWFERVSGGTNARS
jgi:putative hydrolase